MVARLCLLAAVTVISATLAIVLQPRSRRVSQKCWRVLPVPVALQAVVKRNGKVGWKTITEPYCFTRTIIEKVHNR